MKIKTYKQIERKRNTKKQGFYLLTFFSIFLTYCLFPQKDYTPTVGLFIFTSIINLETINLGIDLW